MVNVVCCCRVKLVVEMLSSFVVVISHFVIYFWDLLGTEQFFGEEDQSPVARNICWERTSHVVRDLQLATQTLLSLNKISWNTIQCHTHIPSTRYYQSVQQCMQHCNIATLQHWCNIATLQHAAVYFGNSKLKLVQLMSEVQYNTFGTGPSKRRCVNAKLPKYCALYCYGTSISVMWFQNRHCSAIVLAVTATGTAIVIAWCF